MSVFAITERTGDKRKVRLLGWCLPFKPFRVGGRMRVSTQWNPGSPVATAQVLGPEEDKTTVQGRWSQRHLGDGTATYAEFNGTEIHDLQQLVSLFEDIRRKGQLLEVTWAEVARRGFLTHFEPAWMRREDCEWQAEFTWTGWAETVPGMLGSVQIVLGDLDTDWRAWLSAMIAKVKAPFDAVKSFTDKIDRQIRKINAAVQELSAAVASAVDAVTSPFAALRRAVGILDTIAQEAVTLRNTIESTVAERTISASYLPQIMRGDAVDEPRRVAMEKWRRDLSAAAREMAARAKLDADKLGRQAQPQLVAMFVAKADQDLRQVSMTYYGTQDWWRALAKYNSIVGSTVPQGTVVMVPRDIALEAA